MKPSSVTFHYVMSKVVSFVNDLSHYNKHVLPHKANLSATNPTNGMQWQICIFFGELKIRVIRFVLYQLKL